MKKIIIGARGSKLSLIQTDIIKNHLQPFLPNTQIEVKVIKTTGDKNMSPVPLDSIGKGWFTKEIDKELLDGDIDMAVHSLKDLPEVLPEGLILAAIPQREDAREALVSKDNLTLDNLKKGSIIGTDSNRRMSQILHRRPDIIVKSIRGNVNRRLEKLDNGEYDGVSLAVAGLKRLGLEKRITQYFPVTDFIPSPGQGALAVVIKKTNKKLYKLLQKINDKPTIQAVKAERAFSKAIGGGCKTPVGAYAEIKKGNLSLHAVVGSLNGKHLVKSALIGEPSKPIILGKELAQSIFQKCSPWYAKYIVITRPDEENKKLAKELKKLSLKTLSYPTIHIESNPLSKEAREQLQNLQQFDWVLFTSSNGVKYFMNTLEQLNINKSILKSKLIGAVGPKTATEAKNYGLTINIIPEKFTTKDLGQALPDLKQKKVLLPRADIATPRLAQQLEKKGATVVNVPIYHTEYKKNKSANIIELIENGQIACLTFTSPSTLQGFIQNIAEKIKKETIQNIPVLVIGPVTAQAAQQFEFQKIVMADTYTTEGMIAKLRENIL
jgi:hydroxymethylbilane synthase